MTSDLGFSGIVIPSAVEGFLPPCGNQRVCAEGKRCLGVVSHATMSFCHRDFSLALEMTTARSVIKTLRRFIIFFAPHHNFSFLIPNSSKDFTYNQGPVLTLNPEPSISLSIYSNA